MTVSSGCFADAQMGRLTRARLRTELKIVRGLAGSKRKGG